MRNRRSTRPKGSRATPQPHRRPWKKVSGVIESLSAPLYAGFLWPKKRRSPRARQGWRRLMKPWIIAQVLLTALLGAAPALAQTSATPGAPSPPASVAPRSDESAVVQELEVVGRRPGPALWRVTRGDSEVVIVGGLSPLPHSLHWNETRV